MPIVTRMYTTACCITTVAVVSPNLQRIDSKPYPECPDRKDNQCSTKKSLAYGHFNRYFLRSRLQIGFVMSNNCRTSRRMIVAQKMTWSYGSYLL